MDAETIVALSTPAGASARAIVRVSGDRAGAAVAAIYHTDKCAWLEETWRSSEGQLDLGDGWPPVPATVFVMRAPRSYTREDVLELHVPGSPPVISAILRRLCRESGVRLAEPGAFTRRAYLSGRIDATQVAAVLDLVRSRHSSTARSAASVLDGEPHGELEALKAALVRLVARLEAYLDFTDDDAAQLSTAELEKDHREALERCLGCRGSLDVRSRDEAVRIALVGRPNAGKTSLFNRLTGGRALVSETPGTTRDVAEESVEQDGLRFVLLDTAGLRETDDVLESRAGELARRAAGAADLRFEVIDGSQMPDDDVPADWRTDVLIVNKIDRSPGLDRAALTHRAGGRPMALVSAVTGEGVEELLDIARRLAESGRVDRSASSWLLAAGHRDTLDQLEAALVRAGDRMKEDGASELAAFELREALTHLEALGTPVRHDEILDVLFGQFCIGK
ncbi:MAG: GTPase [Planctomycetota bacterium]